jgi:hypothetical protein
MLLEVIIATAIGTAEVQINEIPGHATVNGYGFSIRETDYGCTCVPKIDEIKLKLGEICYRVKNEPDFHRIDDRWGWSLWEWIGKRTNEEYIK